MGHRQPPLRQRIEAAIERLIAMLDEFDGDPELEDNGDLEPSFGGSYYYSGGLQIELEGDSADSEPWLGWTEAQSRTGGRLTGRSNEATEGGDGLRFNGRGIRAANSMLSARRLPTVRVPIGYGE